MKCIHTQGESRTHNLLAELKAKRLKKEGRLVSRNAETHSTHACFLWTCCSTNLPIPFNSESHITIYIVLP